MFSSRSSLSTLVLACALLAGCGSDDPLAPDNAVSASVVASVPAGDSVLYVGDSMRVSTAAFGTNPKVRTGTTYSSSDTSVATVDRNGWVRARKVGRTQITARYRSGVIRFWLSVIARPVAPLPDTTVKATPDTAPTVPPVPPASNAGLPAFNTPMLPGATVNVAVPAVTGKTLRPAANDAAALQSALNSAVAGDEIVLPNGSVYTGNFQLPKHAGTGRVILRSETVGVAPGTGVTPATSSGFATITTPNTDAALTAQNGSAGWHVLGIRVTLGQTTAHNYGIVRMGLGSETAMADFPSDIVLDRVYITATTEGQTSRCVAMNGSSLAVVNSWLADCHSKGFDSQAIGGWSGTGPYLIENNRLEGSGQAVMFGGGDPKIADVVPSDITIRRNHMFKPLSWGNGKWTIKATFELKNARRVLFEGNVLENHWIDAQVGYAILFQAANQDGTAPWSTIKDVTVQNNIIRNSTSGINLRSRGPAVNDPTTRVLVRNNTFEQVGKDPFTGASGRFAQLLGDLNDATIMQNTWTTGGAQNAIMFDGDPSVRTVISNNYFAASEYGMIGSGTGEGTAALTQFAPGALFTGNVMVGRPDWIYPASNFFPASSSSADFVNAAGGDFTLLPSLPFSTYNGAKVGVTGSSVLAATSGVIR